MYFILKNASFPTTIGTITVQEGQVGGGGGSSTPTNVTFTINPTPSNATVTLTASGYTQSGNSITVLSGTKVNYTVSASGYTSKSGSKTVSYTQSLGVTLSAEGSSGGSGGTNTPVNPPSGGNGITWYINSLDAVAATGKDITGGVIFTGSSIAPVAFDNTFNAKLVGKTIDTVEFVPEKAGKITFGVYNTTTYAYTEKASITIAEADLNTRKIYTFTPFTVSSGELFTFYKSGNVGCMSYYLAKDVSGVDYCRGLQTKCNGAAPTAFNYDIITLINVGTSSAGSGSGSGGGSSTTPTGTTWYIQSLQQLQDTGNDIAANRVKLQSGGGSYSWAFNQFNAKLEGKTINTIDLVLVYLFHLLKL